MALHISNFNLISPLSFPFFWEKDSVSHFQVKEEPIRMFREQETRMTIPCVQTLHAQLGQLPILQSSYFPPKCKRIMNA